MDYVREALDKANVSLDKSRQAATVHSIAPSGQVAPLAQVTPVEARVASPPPPPTWAPRQVQLDPRHLERNRVVSFSMTDPSHVPFNLLRTRVWAAMTTNSWKSIGITSPTPGCGKTMVAANLAISLARGENLKTVLIDLDLKRPTLMSVLGTKADNSIGDFLSGEGRVEDCFVEVVNGLTVGLGGGHRRESTELLHAPRTDELLGFIATQLKPDVLLFDLPPMQVSDDVIAFLPRIDAALLVAASGQTKVTEIDNCEQQISQHGHFLGVVLNKAETQTKEYYY